MCVCVCVCVWEQWLGLEKKKGLWVGNIWELSSKNPVWTLVLCMWWVPPYFAIIHRKLQWDCQLTYSLFFEQQATNKATNPFQRLRHMMSMGKCFPVCQKGIISCLNFHCSGMLKKGSKFSKMYDFGWPDLSVKPRSEKGPSSRKRMILDGLTPLQNHAKKRGLVQENVWFWMA